MFTRRHFALAVGSLFAFPFRAFGKLGRGGFLGGATEIFSYPNFATSTGLNTAASAIFSDDTVALTPAGGGHQAGAVWYTTQQDVSQGFTSQFTFQFQEMPSSAVTIGMAFVIQNTTATANPDGYGIHASADANCCGLGSYNPSLGSQYPLINSVGIKFDANNIGQTGYPTSGLPNSTGLYINGGPWGGLLPCEDLNPSGINFYNSNVIEGTVTYDGSSTIVLVLEDTVTGAQFRREWPVNIQNACSSDLCYLGFTAGQVISTSNPEGTAVLSWTHWKGRNTQLASPTFSPAPGEYGSSQTVTISGPSGATIYYTTNGLDPTAASTLYSGSITVSANQIVKAVAIKSGYTDSYVATAQYQIGTSNVINFPSGFSTGDGMLLVGRAVLNGSAIQLTDTNSVGLEVGGAWFAAPVSIANFTAIFTLTFTSASANGLTFVIQNDPAAYSSDSTAVSQSGGPLVMGFSQSGLGYGGQPAPDGGLPGILSSAAIAFDLYNVPNSVGFYSGGATPTGSQTSITGGLNIASGHPIQCTVGYSGTTLTLAMLDTVNSDTFNTNWTGVDLETLVGGSTAYVGFEAATGGEWANQFVESFTLN